MNRLIASHPLFAQKGGLKKVAIDFRGEIASLKDEMIEMRRDFHRKPEPAFKEVQTSKVVARRLEEYGLEVKTGIAKTGR